MDRNEMRNQLRAQDFKRVANDEGDLEAILPDGDKVVIFRDPIEKTWHMAGDVGGGMGGHALPLGSTKKEAIETLNRRLTRGGGMNELRGAPRMDRKEKLHETILATASALTDASASEIEEAADTLIQYLEKSVVHPLSALAIDNLRAAMLRFHEESGRTTYSD